MDGLIFKGDIRDRLNKMLRRRVAGGGGGGSAAEVNALDCRASSSVKKEDQQQ